MIFNISSIVRAIAMDFFKEFWETFWNVVFHIAGYIIFAIVFFYVVIGVPLAALNIAFDLDERWSRKKPAAPKATPARQSRCDCTKSEKG